MTLLQVSPVLFGYVTAFSVAAAACFLAAVRARRIDHADTRWGLTMFLVLVGVWSLFEVGRLLVPSVEVKVTFYLLGLVVGLASGGAWLYFTSAYAGYTYHRNPTYQRVAGVVFLGLVSLKLTNPIHGLYFTASVESEPFRHLVIHQGLIHWGIAAFLYFVAGIGFYMLFQLFVDSHVSTTSLGVVMSLAALPVVFDVFGFTGLLLELNYEPIGVAAFGIGALYFTEESFVAVRGFGRQQIVDSLSEAVILVDNEGRIRDSNRPARALFPRLSERAGESLAALDPQFEDGVAATPGEERAGFATERVLQVERDGETRYYTHTETPLTVGPHTIGRALVLVDVTEIERQRRELRRQNEQFDGFAAAVAHELRNAVSIVSGNLELASQALADGDSGAALAGVERALERSERMGQTITDLSTLARFSRTVTEPEEHEFAALFRTAWGGFDTGELSLDVEGDGVVLADRSRFVELVRNVVLFARGAGADGVSVAVVPGGFTITITGAELTDSDPEGLFEYGTAVPDAETGMLAANVGTLARAHDWQVDAECDGDIRFAVSGVRIGPVER